MKILNLCPYWISRPNSGGSIRVYNLNRELSNHFKIHQLSFRPRMDTNNNIFKNHEIKTNENYSEFQYSFKSILLSSYLLYKLNLPHDILQSFILEKINFSKKIKGDIIQVEHPWLFEFAYKNYKDKPIVLASHNVEYILIKDIINKDASYFKSLLPKIRKIEVDSLEKSDMIFCVSDEDIKIFKNDFNIKKEKMRLIPNGVNCKYYNILSETEKQNFKRKLNLPLSKIVLFIGSDHYPNREAISFIKKFAKENTDVYFLVVGAVGKGLKNEDNLIFTGHVKDLISYVNAADIAINPLASGSGTNLKMLEYLAAGIPTITTKVGNRGLDLKNEKDVLISELDDFSQKIANLICDEDLYDNLRYDGRDKVERIYDWPVIAAKVVECYNELLNE
jgi:glycosyltransferase involved in cell wall biosynthesis